MREFGVILLAAGGSRRLGEPKQLLQYQGSTLIERACEVAVNSGAKEIVVVLGANSELITPLLQRFPITIVINSAWELGLAGSIRMGIEALSASVDSAVVCLADQPKVQADHLRALAWALGENAQMAASRYPDGTLGVPSAFSRTMFGRLLCLEGDQGARDLLRGSDKPPALVDLREPADVDTRADVDRLPASGTSPGLR